MTTTYETSGVYLGRLADVFGDPTRRKIYGALRESGLALSAGEVGELFGLHRTVARVHLEKLREVGLVETGIRRRAAGGRPAKTYRPVEERVEIMLPPRRYDHLARLALRLIATTSDPATAPGAALALGRDYGEENAARITAAEGRPAGKAALEVVVEWMDACGYRPVLEATSGASAVRIENCVYRELAQEFTDLVCGFDRGAVCGLCGVGVERLVQTHSLMVGDDFCRFELRGPLPGAATPPVE